MDGKTLTPEESLLLITKTIEETKERFQENGHILVFWGTLILVVFASQVVLSLLELYQFMIYPVYLFPIIGGGYMLYVWMKEKKKNKPKTIIGNLLGNIGWIIGLNLLIMGFLFWSQLGKAMGPVFLILLALMVIICGLSIRFKPFTIGGIIVNVIALGSFLLDPKYHGFSIMLGAVVGFIIPGILLNKARRKEHV